MTKLPTKLIKLLKESGAKRSAIPKWVPPQLASLVDKTPEGANWLHENKFDGYRLIIKIDKGKVYLITRNCNDWTATFPKIEKAIKALGLKTAYLDSEVAATDDDGATNFQILQNAIKGRRNEEIVLFLFDCMYLEGYDLREIPLIQRKEILKLLVARSRSNLLHYSEHLIGRGAPIFKAACSSKFEGLVSKAADGPYLSGRSFAWVKSKCLGREEFVIGGFTPHSKHNSAIGALLIGAYNKKGELIFRGKVGTGFNDRERRELYKLCSDLKQPSLPFKTEKRIPRRSAIWIKPKLVTEIKFTEMTNDGSLRHPSYLGLRYDKKAKEVIQEPTK